MEILFQYVVTSDWATTMQKVLPQRKGAVLKTGEADQEGEGDAMEEDDDGVDEMMPSEESGGSEGEEEDEPK